MKDSAETVRVAVVQMNSTLDFDANLQRAETMIATAASDHAQLVVLPELFSRLGPLADVVVTAESIPDGPTTAWACKIADRYGIILCAGSLAELPREAPAAAERNGRVYNTSLLIGPEGDILSAYRKRHLFEANLAGAVAHEPNWFLAGRDHVFVETAIGCIGQSICFDLRFPELFQWSKQSGVQIQLLPSAFTRATGQDHWEPLVRARAIENQVFMIAANQVGRHGEGLQSHGHSMIVDPWGNILAEGGHDDEGVVISTINLAEIEVAHGRIPLPHNPKMN